MPQVTACFLFVAAFTVPMMNYPMRITLHFLLHGETESSHMQHVVESVTPVLSAFLVAMFVTDVGLVFSFVGSVAASSTCFLFPCALFLASRGVAKSRSVADVALCCCVAAFGVVLLVLGVVAALQDAAK